MRALQERRTWLIGGAVAAVLIPAASWFFVISPEMSSTSTLRSDAAAAADANSLTQIRLQRLKRESADLGTLTTSLTQAMAALPPTSGMPEFTRQLSQQAAANAVHVTSITVGTVTAVDATGAKVTATGTGSLYAIPVTLISTGSLRHHLQFLEAMQADGPRRALVNSTQIAPSDGAAAAAIDDSATFTTQVTVFSAPQTPEQMAQLAKLLRGDISD